MSEQITNFRDLQKQAAGLGVHFTWMGVKVTLTLQEKDQVAKAFDASPRSLVMSKKIIDTKNPFYRKLTQIKTQISSLWRTTTLPWVEDGIRLIRKQDIARFNEQFNDLKNQLKDAASDFAMKWQEIVEDGKDKLGNLANDNDYKKNVLDAFDVYLSWPNLEVPEYLKDDPVLYEAEQKKREAQFAKALKTFEEGSMAQLYKLVQHLDDKLKPNHDGSKKIFKDASVDNLIAFFETFRKLNVRSNEEIETLVNKAETLVSGLDPELLRANDQIRNQVSQQMDNLVKELESKVTLKPRRKITVAKPIQVPQPQEGDAA